MLGQPSPLDSYLLAAARQWLQSRIMKLSPDDLAQRRAYLKLQWITGVDSHRLRRWCNDLGLDPYKGAKK